MAISLKSTVAAPVAAYPALKSSIVLFDCNPGTRSWTVPEGVSKIRAFVVGAGGGGWATNGFTGGSGGGYSEKVISVTPGQVLSYTVGSGGAPSSSAPTAGGASSFGGIISATGGGAGGNATLGPVGAGSGGDVNTSGGTGATGTSSSGLGGGGSGHAFGDGQNGVGTSGGGFSESWRGLVDGWKIGIVPAIGIYGSGAASLGTGATREPGMGGGGASQYSGPASGGIGGGGAASGAGFGGPGLVGIEVIA